MALSIQIFSNYTAGNTKIAQRVKKFLFDAELGVVKAAVQASMRDRCYDVEVNPNVRLTQFYEDYIHQ